MSQQQQQSQGWVWLAQGRLDSLQTRLDAMKVALSEGRYADVERSWLVGVMGDLSALLALAEKACQSQPPAPPPAAAAAAAHTEKINAQRMPYFPPGTR
jgi:hypothetical protein